jgi:thiol:disulfide interchange protein DsbD
MKQLIYIVFAFFAIHSLSAQVLKPTTWTSKIEQNSETEFTLIFQGVTEKDWHVYSQFTPDDGPLPLEFNFKEQDGNYKLIGKAVESKYEKVFNETFGVDEYYFTGKFTIKQKIKILNATLKTINVQADYQVCKDVCINAKEKFTFAIPKIILSKEVTKDPTAEVVVPTTTIDSAITVEVATTTKENKTTAAAADDNSTAASEEEEEEEEGGNSSSSRGLLTIFFIAFLSGFAALLTPCVFPLIPMTVSFFTKQSKTKAAGIKNAIIYGISIIVIYVALGSIVTAIFGADALNSLATNVWFNLIFFVLLIIFATSFLGAFEIMLPNSWANKVDKQADRGGVIGILFMALALAIVSFSCTGPIVGTLLFEAASQGGIGPIVGMFGFSLALALPFMLFALFPGWLNTLPKSGGWLNTVKVFLGFLELALAFKFLSNADLVLQLHLIEREVFLAIWIAIFGTLALYLFGKITMPHDSPLPYISVGRLMTGLLVLTFTIYLVPGLWGAPLKIISAFPPPMTYSESPNGVGSSAVSSQVELPEGAVFGPHNIVAFEDYDEGLAYAKKVNKPVLIDFTGHACVNCRKMENNVWSEPDILPILKNDVVLISLYVDDKRDLPKEDQFYSKETDSEIETIGDKWTDFMLTRYKTNTQPLYVLIDADEKNLNPKTPTISYTSASKYEEWLKKGLSNFKK